MKWYLKNIKDDTKPQYFRRRNKQEEDSSYTSNFKAMEY